MGCESNRNTVKKYIRNFENLINLFYYTEQLNKLSECIQLCSFLFLFLQFFYQIFLAFYHNSVFFIYLSNLQLLNKQYRLEIKNLLPM